ncbi:MAG: hypothetical protein RDU13_10585 [Elusimicrobiales bacterium]|jgi:hypothetical protein|nr:hypothetical protein [Elusimicrobiales bacterium]
MTSPFSETLVKLRKAAGFATAYRFFHDSGGQPVLKITYRKYLLWEQGQVLPAIESLTRLAPALKLLPNSGALGGLAASWLRTMAGEETYGYILRPIISVKEDTAGLPPMHSAMGHALNSRKCPVTVAQAAASLESFDHHKAFLFVTKDGGDWTAERLASCAGLAKKAAASVCKDFLAAGIFKKAKKDAFICPLAGVLLEFPRPELLPPGYPQRAHEFQRRLLDEGRITWRRCGFIRADREALTGFLPIIDTSVLTAHAYESADGGALFAVEGRLVKLSEFNP